MKGKEEWVEGWKSQLGDVWETMQIKKERAKRKKKRVKDTEKVWKQKKMGEEKEQGNGNKNVFGR